MQESARNAGFAYLCLLLAGLPWLLGGNRAQFLAPTVVASSVVCTVLLLAALFARKSKLRRSVRSLLLVSPLLVVAFWIYPWASTLLPDGIKQYAYFDQHAQKDFFFATVGVVSVFVIAFNTLTKQSRIQMLIYVLLFSAVLQVAYSVYYLGGGERFLYWPDGDLRLGSDSVASGNYPNRNHFAGFLEMVAFLSLGLLVAGLGGAASKFSFLRGLRDTAAFFLSKKGVIRLAIVICIIGLVLTRSRMGNVAFGTTVLVFGVLLFASMPGHRRGIGILVVSMVLIDVLVVSNFVGLEQVVDRIEQTNTDTEVRLDFSRDTIALINDHWATGVGGGNYFSAIRGYQGIDIPVYFIHAHNDYLQFAAELGVPAFALLVLFAGASIMAGFYAMLRRQHSFYRGTGAGAAAAAVSLCIHASVDFNHQIPANAHLFVVCLAICWLSLYNDKRRRS